MKPETTLLPEGYEITSLVGPGWHVTLAPRPMGKSFQTVTGQGPTKEDAIRDAVNKINAKEN